MNVLSAFEYFRALGLAAPKTVVCASMPLSVEPKSALMLALVESLWSSLDEARLCLIGQEAEENLKYCQGHQLLQRGCRGLIEILSQMVDRLKKGDLTDTDILQGALHTHCSDLSQYFSWLYQQCSVQELAGKISEEYCKVVEVYTVFNGQLALSANVGQTCPKQYGFEKVILLISGDRECRILYEYSPFQIASIRTMIYRAQQQMRVALNILENKQSQLKEYEIEFESKDKQLREAQCKMRTYKHKIRQSDEENKRLKRQVTELNADKQRLERQSIQLNTNLERKISSLTHQLGNISLGMSETHGEQKQILMPAQVPHERSENQHQFTFADQLSQQQLKTKFQEHLIAMGTDSSFPSAFGQELHNSIGEYSEVLVNEGEKGHITTASSIRISR